MNKHTSNQAPEKTSAIDYPCEFVIKMMGKNNDEFIERAKAIILEHFSEQQDACRGQNYGH